MNGPVAAAPRRYALSFTTGTLLAREAAMLAAVYIERRDWEGVRDRAVEGNLLQARTHRTGVRLVRETVKRLSALADDEVQLLTEATASLGAAGVGAGGPGAVAAAGGAPVAVAVADEVAPAGFGVAGGEAFGVVRGE